MIERVASLVAFASGGTFLTENGLTTASVLVASMLVVVGIGCLVSKK